MSTTEKTVLAPVSATVAKLLHKLQGELLKAAPEVQGRIVLEKPNEVTIDADRHMLATFISGPGYSLNMYATHGDRNWPYWWGVETITDAAGREWSRFLKNYITDDFGTLVPVEA